MHTQVEQLVDDIKHGRSDEARLLDQMQSRVRGRCVWAAGEGGGWGADTLPLMGQRACAQRLAGGHSQGRARPWGCA